MRRVAAALFFLVGAVAGPILLQFGLWIFLVSAILSPTMMICGALLLAATGHARRAHRRARAVAAN